MKTKEILEQSIDQIKFSEIVKVVESLDRKEGNWLLLKIAFLRNITIDPIIPYIKFLCYQHNIRSNIYMGDYNNVMQDVINPGSALYNFAPDIIVLSLKIEMLAERFIANFSSMSSDQIIEETDRIINFVDKILREIRGNTQAIVLLHNFEIPVYPAFGILDYQDNSKQVNTLRKINNELLNIVGRYHSVYIVDLDLLKSTIGHLNFFDNRYWHIGKAPYSREASKSIAKEYIKFIRAIKGKNKKCLILDCDNTIWGGIIGEDGIDKIEIGQIYPGSAYREFQQAILNLYHRGIILAICSKNNESDVLEVLEKHPDMILKKEHFITTKINWNDKVSNLQEIANELNIGLDSLVLVDDSDFEVNLIKKMLPEVTTIKLPKDPSSYRDLLNSSGFFDALTFSEEDQKRNEMYRAETKRNETKAAFQTTSPEDYYRYLEMEVFIGNANEFSIPRISQLTQKTNQFNLTTKRYSEVEIEELAKSVDVDIFYLCLEDRFGDSGLVGVAILEYIGKEAIIDTFLLSCRVIGRGVEEVLLKVCADAAIRRECEQIIGLYRPTKKNGQVKEFYRNHLFSYLAKNDGDDKYIFLLKDPYPDFPDYFKSINYLTLDRVHT